MQRSQRIAQFVERIGRLMTNAQHADGFKPVQWEALRYLSQANIFSRNPGSLAQFLGVTKGTVSQTLSTLEQRGLLNKKSDKKDKRVVRLELTARGRALVAIDPLKEFSNSIDSLSNEQKKGLEAGLASILREYLVQNGRQVFGQCRDCRHKINNDGQFRCGLLDEPLDAHSTELICAEFDAAT